MKDAQDDFEMQEEYDFSGAMPNPYAQRFQELNLISLDPDVKAAFPNSEAVNDALRLLMRTAENLGAMRKAS